VNPSFTTTYTERHQGSVRSSDDLRDREGHARCQNLRPIAQPGESWTVENC
jgi:hypothetical protein